VSDPCARPSQRGGSIVWSARTGAQAPGRPRADRSRRPDRDGPDSSHSGGQHARGGAFRAPRPRGQRARDPRPPSGWHRRARIGRRHPAGPGGAERDALARRASTSPIVPGTLRAGLGVRADGAALLTLLDQTDRPRVELKAYGDGRPSLACSTRAAGPVRCFALTAEGATGLTLYDRNGRRRSANGHGAGGRARGVALRRRGQRPRDARRHRDGQPTLISPTRAARAASGCG